MADCAFFRRIRSHVVTDSRFTYKEHLTGVFPVQGVNQKVIFANHHNAVAEYISKEVPLGTLSDFAMLAIACKLASLSAPLIVGKGATALRQTIKEHYMEAKAEAQALDQRENFNFYTESTQSEFVAERLSYW